VQGCRLQDQQRTPIQSYIWQLPAAVVAPYATIDAVRTLEVFEILKRIVEREKTETAYRLEPTCCRWSTRCAVAATRIDQDAAEQTYDLFIGKRNAALEELSDQHGAPVSMTEIRGKKWAGKDLRQPTASAIRAPQKATRVSRPRNWDGWQNTRIGYRVGSRSRTDIITQVKRLSEDISSNTPSTGAFTAKSVRTSQMKAARSHSG